MVEGMECGDILVRGAIRVPAANKADCWGERELRGGGREGRLGAFPR